MPTISMFFGLMIEMFYAPKEHNPPHIHVYYQDEKASVNILTAEVMDGYLPIRQFRFVQAWIEIHREELLANWTLCQNGKSPFKIDPLK
jgi:hypothetical protein